MTAKQKVETLEPLLLTLMLPLKYGVSWKPPSPWAWCVASLSVPLPETGNEKDRKGREQQLSLILKQLLYYQICNGQNIPFPTPYQLLKLVSTDFYKFSSN
jgi:hypothetical protein